MTRLFQLGDRLVFECPGCGTSHHTRGWKFNGDFDRPTLSPSILVRWQFEGRPDKVCHSFVRDGRIEFLGDCTHALAGQTVDLPEIQE